MSLKKQIDRLLKFDELVRTGRAVNPEMTARLMGLSRAQFFVFLKEAKAVGCPVACTKARGYHYPEKGSFGLIFEKMLK